MDNPRLSPDTGGLEHAIETVETRLDAANGVLLCVDVDGVLTSGGDHPVTESKRQLRRLQETGRATVAVVSARELVDLRSRVALAGSVYAGDDGIERHVDGETTVHPVARGFLDSTRRVRTALSDAYRSETGLHVEDRGWSVSVHYRPADVDRASELVDDVTTIVERVEQAEHVEDGRLDVVHEDHTVDVRPTIEWDRGVCVETLVDDAPDDYLPVYLGADDADRPAFRAVERHGGVSVGVGRGDAQTRLDGPAERTAFLHWVAESQLDRRRVDVTAHRPHSA